MAFQFLTQSPASTETKDKLAQILAANNDGRIFVLTGNVSAQQNDIAADMLLALIEWAAAGERRELEIWVGVWVDSSKLNRDRNAFEQANPEGHFKWNEDQYLTTEKVASDLATLYVQAENRYKARRPSPQVIHPRIEFFAVKKWHAKAIGLTGIGEDFTRVQCAIFGSTNFSGNALGGKSFELDLYMDREHPNDAPLLDAFIDKIGLLMQEARANHMVPDFRKLVLQKITAKGSKSVRDHRTD